MMRAVGSGVAFVVLACGGQASPTESMADTGEATNVAEATAGGGSTDASGSTSLSADSTDATESTGADVVPWSGPLRVMTFNVLCSFCDGTYAPWDARVPWIADTVVRHEPDVVGLQELVTAAEVDQLLAELPEFSAIYFGEGEAAYPDATILYRPDQVEPLEQGWYWNSPTPDDPFSTGFIDGVQFPRIVGWAVLRRLSDDAQLLFSTTHFDNNAPSQELSAPLALERLGPFAATVPVVFVGDYNSRPDSVAYGILTGQGGFTDSFDLAPGFSVVTNLPRRPVYDPTERIDHIFVTGGTWSASSWMVDEWIYGDDAELVSDHFAIVADLTVQ